MINFLKKKINFTPKETQIINIVELILKHLDTTVLVDPTTDNYLIENKKLNYYIFIGDDHIQITNHKFYYTSKTGVKFAEKVIAIVLEYIHKDRDRRKNEMFINEEGLLSEIEFKIRKKLPTVGLID